MFVLFSVHCEPNTRNFHYHYYDFIYTECVCVCVRMCMCVWEYAHMYIVREGCSFDQSQCLYMKSKVCACVHVRFCVYSGYDKRAKSKPTFMNIDAEVFSLSALFVNFRDFLPLFAIHAVASC